MIIHIDMDAFYASIEERDQPELKGRPIVVGGKPGSRGVVAAANYAARKYGVHSAMSATIAYRRCPNLLFLPPRIAYYSQVSKQIQDIFHRFTPLVEPLSLDEAFLDVQDSRRLFGSTEEIAKFIKNSIAQELQLVASVGIGPNKFIAKIASDIDKPNGFKCVTAQQAQAFLDPLPVTRIWGVGKAAEKKLHANGIRTIAQLRSQSVEAMQHYFGGFGIHIWQLAHGKDDRRVVPDHQAKSISHETTFPADIHDRVILKDTLRSLTQQVCIRLRRADLLAKRVELKLRFSNFKTITRSKTIAQSTNLTAEIWREVISLFNKEFPDKVQPLRLVGIGLSELSTQQNMQMDMFSQPFKNKYKAVDEIADKIRDRFGSRSITIGLNKND